MTLVPIDGDTRTPVRIVLVFGIITGFAMTLYFTVIAPVTPLAWDFIAYYQAAEAMMAGESFVGLQAGGSGGEYVYPPVVVLGFIPYLVFDGWPMAFVFQGTINLLLLGGLVGLVLLELDRLDVALEPVDRALIASFGLVSLYPLVAIGLGQIDPLIAVIVAVVFVATEAGRSAVAGLALAAAASVKLFPAAFGLWLVVRQQWVAAVVAVIGMSAAAAASLAVFGTATNIAYIELILTERSRLEAFALGMSPDFFAVSLVRPIAWVLPTVPPVTYLIVSVAVVTPPLWYIYRHTTNARIDRHVVYLGTLLGVLIALPSTNLNHFLYLYFPLIVLLYGLEVGRARRWLLVGTAVLLVPVQPAIIATTLRLFSLPVPGADAMGGFVEQLLSIASVGLVGAVVLLAACVIYTVDIRSSLD